MIKKTTIFRTLAILILGSILVLMNHGFASAEPNNATINYFNQNGIYYYDPTGNQANYSCGAVVSDCGIRGDTAEERLWSGIRSKGFTPEQTAAMMGNFLHEAGSPTRQEDAYNIARDKGVLTQEGNPYTIWTDTSEHHSAGMQSIYSSYKAGNQVAGIGIGIAGWTDKGLRETYLHKMEANGLLKYFEGDAYKTYGKYTDAKLKETIIEETGSEDDYWALWCTMLDFLKEDIDNRKAQFYNEGSSVDHLADYFATDYERCVGCQSGDFSNVARRQTAKEVYEKFQNGEFDSVENATASSASTNASGSSHPTSTSSTETGSNVLIIGDSITVMATSVIEDLLPDVTIDAEGNRTFAEGLDILEKMPQGSIPDIIVFALGTNGGATQSNAEKVLEIAGDKRQVVFVTDYALGDSQPNYMNNANALFSSLKDQYNNVVIAGWAAAVANDPAKYIMDEPPESVFYDVHPTTPDGVDLFAKVLYEAITNGTLHAANNAICAGNFWDGSGLPEYLQCDSEWGNLSFNIGGINSGQGPSICTAGCGPTSFAIMATVLLGREILPSETADIAGRKGMYVDGKGSDWEITRTLANYYGLQFKNFSTSQEACIDTINKALSDGWMIHTSGTGSAPFSSVGHYIGIAGITPNGDWIIANSNKPGNGTFSPSTVLNAGMYCGNLKGIKQ